MERRAPGAASAERGAAMGTTRRMGSIWRFFCSTLSGASRLALLNPLGVSSARWVSAPARGGRVKQRIESCKIAAFAGPSRPPDISSDAIRIPLRQAALYSPNVRPRLQRAGERFIAVETVPIRQLHGFIADGTGVARCVPGDRGSDYNKFGATTALTTLLCLLPSADLRSLPLSGAQKLVLSGIAASFLIYLLALVTEGLSKAELMYPAAAACLPVLVGGVTGLMSLLHREDG